jgi:alpha-methylacyl-CoA racemase
MNSFRSFEILQNIKVLELEGLAPSVFCGMILADYGAEVILVNRKESSEISLGDQQSDYLNRGKKSILLDLKDEHHLLAFKKLCEKSDVIIDPYRPGVLEKIGIGPKILMEINPRIIICRISGFGQSGPYAKFAGHDMNYLALSGYFSTIGGTSNKFNFPGNMMADFAGGSVIGVLGILLAIYQRNQTGRGQVIDVSMTEGASYLNLLKHHLLQLGVDSYQSTKNKNEGNSSSYNRYLTKDGKEIAITEPENIELPEYLKTGIEGHKFTDSEENMTKHLDDFKIKYSPVNTFSQLPTDKEVQSRNSIITKAVENGKITPANFEFNPSPKIASLSYNLKDKKAPKKGENTNEILIKYGLSTEEIQKIITPSPKL